MIEPFIVVWCDSIQGLISTRTWENNEPVTFNPEQLPDTVVKVESETELYDILKKRDGTKVAFSINLAYSYLGWDI